MILGIGLKCVIEYVVCNKLTHSDAFGLIEASECQDQCGTLAVQFFGLRQWHAASGLAGPQLAIVTIHGPIISLATRRLLQLSR
jgi:hypothetical protein